MTYHGRHRGKDYLVPASALRLWRRRGGEVVSKIDDDAVARAETKQALGEIRLVLDWRDEVQAEVEPAPTPKRKRKA